LDRAPLSLAYFLVNVFEKRDESEVEWNCRNVLGKVRGRQNEFSNDPVSAPTQEGQPKDGNEAEKVKHIQLSHPKRKA
jgi:hypothetical protein